MKFTAAGKDNICRQENFPNTPTITPWPKFVAVSKLSKIEFPLFERTADNRTGGEGVSLKLRTATVTFAGEIYPLAVALILKQAAMVL